MPSPDDTDKVGEILSCAAETCRNSYNWYSGIKMQQIYHTKLLKYSLKIHVFFYGSFEVRQQHNRVQMTSAIKSHMQRSLSQQRHSALLFVYYYSLSGGAKTCNCFKFHIKYGKLFCDIKCFLNNFEIF